MFAFYMIFLNRSRIKPEELNLLLDSIIVYYRYMAFVICNKGLNL